MHALLQFLSEMKYIHWETLIRKNSEQFYLCHNNKEMINSYNFIISLGKIV